MARLTIDGYGQLELNNVAFRRDGRVEAQCGLNKTDFTESAPAENGMILVVDNVAREIKLPAATDTANTLYALNYSAEKNYSYDEYGLKDFSLKPGGFYPRLGYLDVGDKFTTNCVSHALADTDAFKTALAAVKSGPTPLYGVVSIDGSIAVSGSAPEAPVGPVFQVIEGTTMPDGQLGVKFQVIAV